MFHKSNFGSFGESLPCDLNGFVPQEGDDVEQFSFDHDEFTQDFDRHGNGYEGAADDAWEEFVARAVAATAEAEAALKAWREGRVRQKEKS